MANVIKQAKNMCMNSRYGPGAITFEFAQASAFPWTPLGCPESICFQTPAMGLDPCHLSRLSFIWQQRHCIL